MIAIRMVNKSLHIELQIESTLVDRRPSGSRADFCLKIAAVMIKRQSKEEYCESINLKYQKGLLKLRYGRTTEDRLKVEKSLCLEPVERCVQQ